MKIWFNLYLDGRINVLIVVSLPVFYYCKYLLNKLKNAIKN